MTEVLEVANKEVLVEAIQLELSVDGVKVTKKDATLYLDAVLNSIMKVTDEYGKLRIFGFGDFEARERAARKGRNPQDGKEIDVEAKRTPHFKALKAFKDAVKL